MSDTLSNASEQKPWIVHNLYRTREVHVVPQDDLVEHEVSSLCDCAPLCLMLGGIMFATHIAADGRVSVQDTAYVSQSP